MHLGPNVAIDATADLTLVIVYSQYMLGESVIFRLQYEHYTHGGSDVISELEHRSLCGRNETRTVNHDDQSEKSARAMSERTENPVGDTAGSVRRATGMETFHNYYVS